VGHATHSGHRVLQLHATRVRGQERLSVLLASPSASSIQTPDFEIDLLDRCVRFPDGEEARFTPRQWRLLELLVALASRPLSAGGLADAIFGEDTPDEYHQLPVLVHQLRRKLEPNVHVPRYLRSLDADTYLFDPDGGQPRPLGSVPLL
jgi:DNA-binding response OmpR family regulator